MAEGDARARITRERGVGEDPFARLIHAISRCARHPLVAGTCAGLPETWLESQVFGHVKGALGRW